MDENSYIESENNDYDMIKYSYDQTLYEKIMFKWLYYEDLITNDGKEFINKYFSKIELNDKYSDRKVRSRDFVLEYGEKLDKSIVLDEKGMESINSETSNINTPITSSQMRFNIKINPNSYDDVYGDLITYENEDEGGYGFSKLNDFSEEVSFNLPFYNWIFEEISSENNYLTQFDRDTNFIISDTDLKKKWFQEEYTIKVYTNTNIRFSIEDDPNVSSVEYEWMNINSNHTKYTFETQFDEFGDEAMKHQRETVTVYYKNKVTSSTYEDKINQRVNIEFNYDSDSPIGNSETTFEENYGNNAKQINSEVEMISTDKEAFLEESDNFELIDLFKVENDLTITLNDAQKNFIANLDSSFGYDELLDNENNEYVENLDRISLTENDGNYSFNVNSVENIPFDNTIILSNTGLYRWNLRTKSKEEYTYWILISNEFIDFGEDDNLSSNNSFPKEWLPLKEDGLIDFDEEIGLYSFRINDQTFYIQDFVNSFVGGRTLEIAKRKGWTRSEFEKEASYSISKLQQDWGSLKDFIKLKIDEELISNTTSNLYEKEKNRFNEIEDLITLEIERQLRDNDLTQKDWEIYFYDETGELMPDKRIIKNKDNIHVLIKSSKRGIGINNYEFDFKTLMIEPVPLWIQIMIVLTVLMIIFTIVLVTISMLNRNKIKKIKG